MRLSRLIGVAAAVAALVLVSPQIAGAQVHPATSGSYTNYTVGPTIYQTYWTYESADVVPPANVPSTGVINSVSYSWSYLNYTAGDVYYYALCDHYHCFLLGSGYGGGASGSTTDFAGDDAQTDFAFEFEVVDSTGTAHTITPSYGARDTVDVNYTS
jgi:hypothetical protein